MTGSPKKIVFVTTSWDDWGGSEELWSRCAKMIKITGRDVIVMKANLPYRHSKYIDLSEQGISLVNIPSSLLLRVLSLVKIRFLNWVSQWVAWEIRPRFAYNETTDYFCRKIKNYRPDLVVISQGINFDGLGYAHVCLASKIPYVLISQKAADFYWPQTNDRPLMKKILQGAENCYFVSKHNLRLTEEQFGFRFARSRVIFNPLKSRRRLAYPNMENGVKLACVARLFVLDKGQDILLRILSKSFWRSKPLHVTFVGDGRDEVALKEMVELLELKNVEFAGFQHNMDVVWGSCHALVLPSRSEGMPLAIMEAMAAGRPAIVTSAGGNAEILEEGKSGFIAETNEKSLNEALVRAWNAREYWQKMGEYAAGVISELVPANVEECIVNDLINK